MENNNPNFNKKHKPATDKGLKKLRAHTDKRGPQYHCSNCNCDRYSPCTCTKPRN